MYYVTEASAKIGLPLIFARHAKRHLEEAGFVDVVEKTAIWPIGDWPKDKMLKEIGRFGRQGMVDSLHPFGISLLTIDGWPMDKIMDLCDRTRDSLVKKQKGDVGKYYFQG